MSKETKDSFSAVVVESRMVISSSLNMVYFLRVMAPSRLGLNPSSKYLYAVQE